MTNKERYWLAKRAEDVVNNRELVYSAAILKLANSNKKLKEQEAEQSRLKETVKKIKKE